MLYLFIWLCDRAPPRARALLPRNPIPIVWLTVGDQCVQCAGAGVLGRGGSFLVSAGFHICSQARARARVRCGCGFPSLGVRDPLPTLAG